MTTPVPPPPAPDSGAAAQTITVNEDNVLEVRKTILSAAEDARERLYGLAASLQVTPPGDDEVSKHAATTWTAYLLGNQDSHFNRLMQYVDNVEKLGEQLGEAAKQYGYTDEEISASFQLTRGAK
ncbi:hypothetical protein QFW96_07945 [Saccharopolyspora sp. TS4A08]|uniref:PE domain-containing protein n=1 Tax=Saccharopolyspora ipomoeae TaxID=3042027 RepID=A0ABT6PKP9_9PSEU|nr:hypothetical protein [Saccharopolyspora sp. TS4A08]MDI2028539.1 hypothetical protein [Saccharopolyspora sp. TS4A08]